MGGMTPNIVIGGPGAPHGQQNFHVQQHFVHGPQFQNLQQQQSF